MHIQNKITVIGMDNFYKGLPKGTEIDDYDFDHPSSLDFAYMTKCLKELIEKRETETPIYDFTCHSRVKDKKQHQTTKEVLILEGILSMYDERIRNLFDLKIFIYCDSDIALARRILRDIKERGRSVESVLNRYNRFVKKDFQKYVKP